MAFLQKGNCEWGLWAVLHHSQCMWWWLSLLVLQPVVNWGEKKQMNFPMTHGIAIRWQ